MSSLILSLGGSTEPPVKLKQLKRTENEQKAVDNAAEVCTEELSVCCTTSCRTFQVSVILSVPFQSKPSEKHTWNFELLQNNAALLSLGLSLGSEFSPWKKLEGKAGKKQNK